jgi:molecular chaperone GrpE
VSTNRAEILSRFEQWLDRTIAAESPPAGLDAELLATIEANGDDGEDQGTDAIDSYSLWAALTGLTQEIKLQGRAFQELNHTIDGQASKVAAELRAEHRERERENQRETERRCRKEMLNTLIDIQDRMERGLEAGRTAHQEISKAPPPGWLDRMLGRESNSQAVEVTSALMKGYELSMERIAQALGDSDARQIRCNGELFDPRRMNAVDREESREVPPGTVLQVYRSGYVWNDEVLRPAQVKVSFVPPSGGAE